MTANKQSGRNIAEKLAVPAILVVSLITARLIVGLRSAIILSGGIELNRLGLSVSIPSGNGWESSGKWSYGEDRFTIISTFSPDQFTRSYTQCRYLLAAEPQTLTQRYEELAAEIEGQVVETGQLLANRLAVQWARIKRDMPDGSGRPGPPEITDYEIIFGICELAGGRELEIEVFTQDESIGPWDIFERIVKAVRFNDNGLLQAGAQIVQEVKKEGLSGTIRDTLSPEGQFSTLFEILNNRGQPVGFAMDAIAIEGQSPASVKAANYYYLRTPATEEHVGVFRGDDALEQFTWRVESTSRIGKKGIEMTGELATEEASGFLTERFAAGRMGGEEKQYVLGKGAFPDIVLEPVLQKLLDGQEQEIIIDVIRSDGTITPVYIEKITPPAREKQYKSALRLEILDERGNWQQIYYDDNGQPGKIILGQENISMLRRATADQIAQVFPEGAEIVQNRNQFLERE